MIQQILLQSYDNIRNRLRSLGESTSDRDFMNGAKALKLQNKLYTTHQRTTKRKMRISRG